MEDEKCSVDQDCQLLLECDRKNIIDELKTQIVELEKNRPFGGRCPCEAATVFHAVKKIYETCKLDKELVTSAVKLYLKEGEAAMQMTMERQLHECIAKKEARIKELEAELDGHQWEDVEECELEDLKYYAVITKEGWFFGCKLLGDEFVAILPPAKIIPRFVMPISALPKKVVGNNE